MKTYLIEAYSQRLKLEEGSNVVALTPNACYELDKTGIKYSILEDCYDQTEILKEEDNYFTSQLTWFDEFDNLLFGIFPEAKIKDLKLATIYYFYIKSMIDSLILRCKVINAFMNKVKPNSIVYTSNSWKEDLISSTDYPLLFRKGQSLFSRLTPIFCEKYNIDFHQVILRKAAGSNGIHHRYKDFISKIKDGLKTSKYVRNLWQYYKTFSINSMFPKAFKDHKYNFLFLKTGYSIKDIMKEAQREGHRVFYKRGNDIIKQSFPYHKLIGSVYPNITSTSEQDIKNFSKEIGKTDILKWVNNYCGADVSNIISPRLRYFIYNFCPQIISLIDKYIIFYDDNQIDIVFTPHMVSVEEYAAIMATRYSKKAKSACLQHGNSAFALKIDDFGEYCPYHIYFTTDYEMEECIKHRIQLGNFNTKVFQYPNRFRMLPKINNLKRKQSSQVAKKTLVYVPTMYQWDNTFWIESISPDTWYFSWHKELMNYFNLRKDFDFIWKGIPASNKVYDPIPNMINDRSCKNIRYATESFVKWIKRADLVLLDYPSTALYEAAVSGLPVMSLYFAPFNVVRESALKLFGKSLQPFSNLNEGIAKIADFLNSNPDEFVVSIPYSEESMLETLKRLQVREGVT